MAGFGPPSIFFFFELDSGQSFSQQEESGLGAPASLTCLASQELQSSTFQLLYNPLAELAASRN